MEERDIEWARLLHNDDSTLFQLTDVEHVTQSQQRKWFEALSLSQASKRYVVEHEGDSIGVFRVDAIDRKNRSMMVGLDIAPEFRGLRLSYPIYRHMLRYFFKQMGMNRVYLKVLETNTRALHVYMKLGFRVEGRDRAAVFRDGAFRDYINMSMLESEFDDG